MADTSLSIVTPSRNPHYSYLQKVSRLSIEHPSWQFIVVDDESTLPLHHYLPLLPNLEILRNPKSIGAGASRNIGIEKIQKEYTVFMDDDDEMNWEVVLSSIARMDQDHSIDISFHLYDLLLDGEYQSAISSDHATLCESLHGDNERIVSIRGNENLLAFTNYPWNKVYRSSFIRASSLHFSETPVQNDVYAHWQTLIRAKNIFLSRDSICRKIEYRNGERIGNISDMRCVKAFQALHETYQLVRLEGGKKARSVFVSFYTNLIRWLAHKSNPEVRVIIFQEHCQFIERMESDGFVDDVESEFHGWEFWDMSIMDEPQAMKKISNTSMSESSLIIAEISRLKRLATALKSENESLRVEKNRLITENEALRADNNQLTTETEALRASKNQLATEINSLQRLSSRKIVRLAIGIGDGFYRLRSWKH